MAWRLSCALGVGSSPNRKSMPGYAAISVADNSAPRQR